MGKSVNYLKVAFRNIRKQRGYSLINVVGLAIGIACSVLVFLYVAFELGYDRYHEKADRIHRLAVTASIGDTKINQTYSSAQVFRKLFLEFPEIETGVKIMGLRTRQVQLGETSFYESRLFGADSTFFDVFDLPVVHGDADRALAEPNMIVLTESTAKKYFGRTDVVGEMLTVHFSEPIPLVVSAVTENVPENSHFRFDFLISSISFPNSVNSTGWTDNRFLSYVVLEEGLSDVQVAALNEKLKHLDKKYNDRDGSYEDWRALGNFWEFFLQPITSIHLDSDLDGEFEANGSRAYVYMFLAIGIIILLIACVNFMNLSTARASLRAREVGIRKVVGSDRKRLVTQFLGESIVLSLLSLGLSLLLIELLLPHFGNLVGRPLEIHYLSNLFTIPALLLLGVTVGIISGSYPSFVLSSFQPVMILKSHASSQRGSVWLRNALIVFQFSIAVFLIICTLTINQQLSFMQSKELGFDKEQVLVVANAETITDNLKAFKETLRGHGDIVSVAGSCALPGMHYTNIGFREVGSDRGITLNMSVCDFDFLETMKLKMGEGRFFSREFASDSSGIVLNRAACVVLGWDEPLGKRIRDCWGNVYTALGVVEDVHYESLHHSVRPMALLASGGLYQRNVRYVAARIGTENVAATVDFVEKTWSEFAPGVPFQYSFLDDDYDKLYFAEQRVRQFTTVLCSLAVFISCIGLFGLASFVADQKCREIGIRRVLGATVSGVVGNLNSSFVRWVLLSNIIAWPTAWYVMSRWLDNFAYRVSPDIWVFGASGVIAVIIALLTVSYQSIKAAIANPVEALRNE
jgi:putative ABC transport system permease protein